MWCICLDENSTFWGWFLVKIMGVWCEGGGPGDLEEVGPTNSVLTSKWTSLAFQEIDLWSYIQGMWFFDGFISMLLLYNTIWKRRSMNGILYYMSVPMCTLVGRSCWETSFPFSTLLFVCLGLTISGLRSHFHIRYMMLSLYATLPPVIMEVEDGSLQY